jgi:hypothetical protein
MNEHERKSDVVDKNDVSKMTAQERYDHVNAKQAKSAKGVQTPHDLRVAEREKQNG